MSVDLERVQPTNPFLDGNFAPVPGEQDASEMEVIGHIPEDLAGSFLRIGPNPQFVPDVGQYHWFDGDGMIHGVEFQGGAATYRSRFIQTEFFLKEKANGTWIWKGFNAMTRGEVSAPSDPSLPRKNPANTAIVEHNGAVYALCEAGEPHAVDVPTLATRGKVDFGGKLKHAFTAHPKVDARTGEMMTFGYSPFPPHLTYSVIDHQGQLVHTTPITLPKGVMMHDCAITHRHTLFLDMPMTFDIKRAMSGGRVLAWEPENGARIGVLPRMGGDGDVRWFEIATGFVFHTSNAWEEGDEIVLLAYRLEKTDIIGAADGAGDEFGQLHEWRLNTKTGRVVERMLDKSRADFCRINDVYIGYPNRYVYSARYAPSSAVQFDALLKYDHETGETLTHSFGHRRFGGEGVFARGSGVGEDRGYVITFVRDEDAGSSECVIIDAQAFEAPPVARIMIPHRVPYGFHAAWIPKRG
jgi:carotenoid cleavage dioxygenase-like enzyme